MERAAARRARAAPRRRTELHLTPRALAAAIGLALGAGCAPGPQGEAAPPAPLASAPLPSLERVSTAPLPGTPAALGLTGANKPNGFQYRLRQSVPAATPALVPRRMQGLELWIADPTPEGWLAFYREPLGTTAAPLNSRYRAVLFHGAGERRWELDLGRFLSRPSHLEIQDIRLHEGQLFFNEACQSYSREAEGRCSSLVRVDPERSEVVWRSRPLVSNDIFLPHGEVLAAGYGFTAEPDSLFLVSRATGEVVASEGLDSAHSYLEIAGGELVVLTRERAYRFRLSEPSPL